MWISPAVRVGFVVVLLLRLVHDRDLKVRVRGRVGEWAMAFKVNLE
jgi:hypothetical protein